MSERNVELHRLLIGAINAGDIEWITAHGDPQAEFHTAFTAVGGGVYHGHDGVRKWHREFRDVWGDEFRVEAEAYFDFGDQTLAFIVARGRGKQSGAEVAMPAAQVARWRDGLCAFFKAYRHREDALTELGVYEDGLEPIEP